MNFTNIKETYIHEVSKLITQAKEMNKKDIKRSFDLLNKAKKLAQDNFYAKGLADVSKQLAIQYSSVSNYAETMQQVLTAIDIYKSLDLKREQSTCLNILGSVYNYLGDYNKRLACNLECLELRRQINDTNLIVGSLNNIGDTYMAMGQLDKAITYFNKCLTYEINDSSYAIVYYNIGEVCCLNNDFNASRKNITKSLDFAKKSKYAEITSACYKLLAEMTFNESEYKKSLTLLFKALESLENHDYEGKYMIYELLSSTYSKLEDFKQAYSYLNKSTVIKKELSNNNNTEQIKKIEFEYQYKTILDESEQVKVKNNQLVDAYNQIQTQNKEIAFKNQEITDSLRYAKRIQKTILPSPEKLKKLFNNCYVLYKPKDIVSGDFYWANRVGDELVFAVVDCTGHGVPGAFMSLIAHNALNKIVLEKKITTPATILAELDTQIANQLNQTDEMISDGLDIGLCKLSLNCNELEFAGAYHTLMIINNGNYKEYKSNRESVGYSIFNKKKEFINHNIKLVANDRLIISTDGYPDQFGGEKGKKLKWKPFKELLKKTSNIGLKKQKEELNNFFVNWKDKHEQTDDVCVFALEV